MKRMYRSILTAVFIIAEALVPAAIAFGQTADQEEDGPGRGVARISLLNGDVSVRRGDSGDWIAAAVNGPLLAEDRVLSGAGARGEVQLDYYDRIRLGSDTEVRFPELEWRKYQVQIAHGTVIFSALPGTNDQIEFATPAASLRPLAAGSYRMTVMEDGTAEFTVRRGEAEIYTPHGTRRLTPGTTMRVHLSPDNVPEFQVSYEVPRDSFDEFSDRRDQELQHVKSYQYVNRDIDGAEDLDNAGEWVEQAPYGWTWRPYVAPGWAPYREGRWVWVDDSYGWTWVSYDPWGWAPYHYGRWFFSAGSWFWYPGVFGGRHYWRPGLVAFFGYGGFGVGVGFGGFGWVPLAPFETFHPWYGRGGYRGFNRNVININNVNITNTYRNARVGNGVSGVNARGFGRGGAVRPVPVSGGELAHASVMHGALPINPTRESLRMSDRPLSGALAARAAQSGNARFIASRPAPASTRIPFESRARGIQSSANTGTAPGLNRTGTAQSSGMRGGGQGTTGSVARSTSQNGWTRSDTQAGASSARSGSSQSSSSPARGGWGSFGTPASGRNASGDSSPSTRGTAQNSTASQRGGWTSFGSPERSTSSSTQSGRGAWGTGGGTGVRVYGQSESPARGSTTSSGGWSTGGGSGYGRYESPSRGGSSPAYSAPAQSSAPHYSSGSSGGGASRQSAPAPSRSSGGGGSHSGGGHSSHR
jgi:hypothetical protein